MVQLELSKKQVHHLIQLLYLGEWVRSAYEKESFNKDIDELEQTLYTIAYNAGIEEVEYDKKLGGYVPTLEFEEDCDELISKYDEHTFLEELIIRFSEKEIEATHTEKLSEKEYEALQAKLIEKYEKEFLENGLTNLHIKSII